MAGGGNWSDGENDLIVDDYLDMLCDDLAGRPYVKRHRNLKLQGSLGRSHGSVEFKHQNISAVLQGLGEPWIIGYKPATNYQDSLEPAVIRGLARRPIPTSNTSDGPAGARNPIIQESAALWIGPPPTQSNTPPPKELDQMLAVARKWDVAERDERNRALGKAGEERVLAHEYATLTKAGRTDLAARICWTSDIDGDGAGYDIASFEPNGAHRLIEVKTTKGWIRTPFYISRNELAVSEAQRENWRLVRLWNFAREPKAFEIRAPLSDHVSLVATAYEAGFG